jgi:4-amino-4-deoxy-L-arabinose transferase-like glycosyltransferase
MSSEATATGETQAEQVPTGLAGLILGIIGILTAPTCYGFLTYFCLNASVNSATGFAHHQGVLATYIIAGCLGFIPAIVPVAGIIKSVSALKLRKGGIRLVGTILNGFCLACFALFLLFAIIGIIASFF